MGGSIGPSGWEISSGSLGGYLQLQQQNSDVWDDGVHLFSSGVGRQAAELWKAVMAIVRMSLSGSCSPPESCQVASAVKAHSSKGGL